MLIFLNLNLFTENTPIIKLMQGTICWGGMTSRTFQALVIFCWNALFPSQWFWAKGCFKPIMDSQLNTVNWNRGETIFWESRRAFYLSLNLWWLHLKKRNRKQQHRI